MLTDTTSPGLETEKNLFRGARLGLNRHARRVILP